MMISHANDAYFSVLYKFSEIEMKTMLISTQYQHFLWGLSPLPIVYIFSLMLSRISIKAGL
jgi:GntP family gluconate:H+ symporter